jgi:dynein heavy chain
LVEFQQLLKSYNEAGPLTPGLTVAETSENLNSFQHQYDNFQKRWLMYSGGQELFGLSRSLLPKLNDLWKQFNNYNRFYSFYNEVNICTRGIRNHLWVDGVFSEIIDLMAKFQSDVKKLPSEKRS